MVMCETRTDVLKTNVRDRYELISRVEPDTWADTYAEGYASGYAEAYVEEYSRGMKEGVHRVARGMLAAGMTVKSVAAITGLTEGTVSQL